MIEICLRFPDLKEAFDEVDALKKENAKLKELLKNLLPIAKFYNKHRDKGAIMDITPIYDAEQFLEEERSNYDSN